jgi:terminase small subunit-like protein
LPIMPGWIGRWDRAVLENPEGGSSTSMARSALQDGVSATTEVAAIREVNMRARTKSRSTQAPAKIGRPTKYSDEWAKRFCDLIAEGQSVRQICSQPGQPDKSQVYRWLDENGDFRDQYARAREEQADKLFREIIEIADDKSGDCITTSDGKPIVDHENIQRSRLRVDARKWAAAKLAPKKYGDRVEHDVKGGVHFQPQILIQCSSDKLDEPQVKIATHHEPSELQ